MDETLMIIDVKDWNRRLQDAIDKAFPGKKLKIDENTKSLTRASPENALFPRRHTLQDKAFLAFRK
jgi:hypothetical protein